MKYRNLRGSLSTPRRLEQALAKVCQLITAAAGMHKDPDTKEGFSLAYFMPHEEGYAEAHEEIDFETLMRREQAQSRR